MIQIIGLLGCLYLLVKGLEIAGSSNHHDAEGNFRPVAMAAAVLAIAGSFLFAYWLMNQAEVMSPGYSMSDAEYSEAADSAMADAEANVEAAGDAVEDAARDAGLAGE